MSVARLAGTVLLATALASCERGPVSDDTVATFKCSLSTSLRQLAPAPAVTFIADTSRAVAAWRAAVGEPIVDRAGRICESARIDSLLVVSWNTHLGHAHMPRFVSDLRHGRVLPGVRVQHFVILVQEAYRESPSLPAWKGEQGCTHRMGGQGADIEDTADSLGLALLFVPSMRNGCTDVPRQDRGNAILSTLPLSNLKAVEVPIVRQRRVVAMADVQGRTSAGDDWTLTLASVHFENRGPGVPRDWVHGRAKQASAVVKNLPDNGLLVVGGDFNTLNGASEPAVRIVGAKFKNTPPHQRSMTFVSYAIMRSHLDYLFFRGVGEHRAPYWRARQRYGSDHYPIMGFVRVGVESMPRGD
jgi:endonuclease/exonuclease/phosphatase family metal-dependent hydrolase